MNTPGFRAVAAGSFFMILGGAVMAQDAPAPSATTTTATDRASAKNDARNAEEAGAMPHGDLPIPAVTPSNAPSPDRATMKRDTAAYNKSKQPPWMPNNGSYNQGNTMKSTADRASVKAATKDAETQQAIPRGQAAQPMTSAQ